MRPEEVLLISRIVKQTGKAGLSDADVKQMYESFGSEEFSRVSDDILKESPNISKHYQELMKDWEANPDAKLPQYEQFKFSCRTAYFRSVTMDTLDQYKAAGVKKVQIVAYMDDHTSEICRDMHGRIFEISDHKEEYGHNVFVPSRERMLSAIGQPTEQIGTILPPYHFNCRSVYVPFEEPKKEIDRIKNDLYNNEKIRSDAVKSILKEALKAKWNNGSLSKHYRKHGKTNGEAVSEYNQEINDNIRKAGREIILGIKQESLNLYILLIRKNADKGSKPHLLTIIDLSSQNIVTSFYCDDRYIKSKIDQLLKTVQSSEWRHIMKSGEAYFFMAGLPDPIEVEALVDDYVNRFLFCHEQDQVKGDSSYDDSFDMYNRYSLHLAQEEEYLSEKQLKALLEADKQHINNYMKGQYRSNSNSQNEEIEAFFEWLSEINN